MSDLQSRKDDEIQELKKIIKTYSATIDQNKKIITKLTEITETGFASKSDMKRFDEEIEMSFENISVMYKQLMSLKTRIWNLYCIESTEIDLAMDNE